MTSRPPVPLSDLHEFSYQPSSTPLPTETPRPLNARRLQPAYDGAWSVGAVTPLPRNGDFLSYPEAKGPNKFKFPDSEAFEWSNLADLYDASGTLRPSKRPKFAESVRSSESEALSPYIFSESPGFSGPSRNPSPLEWIEPAARTASNAATGLSVASSVQWSNLAELLAL